jgi:salicylate hydroxylase
VRRGHFGAGELAYAGKLAARALIAPCEARAGGPAGDTSVWLAPGAHVVRYPVMSGGGCAVVAILTHPRPDPGWAAHLDGAILAAAVAGFADEVRAMLAAADGWRAWALFDPEPLPAWSRGRVGLVGDAAHPVLPFLAQGGVMALEDAVTLARLLARDRADPAAALAAFARVRRARVAAVQQASRTNGRIYHLAGLAAAARDLALRALPARRVMAGLDWLYGWRPEGS